MTQRRSPLATGMSWAGRLDRRTALGPVGASLVAAASLIVLAARSAEPSGPKNATFWQAVGNTDTDCGVVLIGPSRVALPAHCLSQRVPSTVAFTGGQSVSIERCWSHPEFDGRTSVADVGVCRLAEAVVGVEPAEVTRSESEGAPLRTGGLKVVRSRPHASASGGDATQPRVVEAVVLRVDNPATMVIREPACYGDSGGAVVGSGGSGWEFIGLVSGSAIGACDGPTVITRVAPFWDWLMAS